MAYTTREFWLEDLEADAVRLRNRIDNLKRVIERGSLLGDKLSSCLAMLESLCYGYGSMVMHLRLEGIDLGFLLERHPSDAFRLVEEERRERISRLRDILHTRIDAISDNVKDEKEKYNENY